MGRKTQTTRHEILALGRRCGLCGPSLVRGENNELNENNDLIGRGSAIQVLPPSKRGRKTFARVINQICTESKYIGMIFFTSPSFRVEILLAEPLPYQLTHQILFLLLRISEFNISLANTLKQFFHHIFCWPSPVSRSSFDYIGRINGHFQNL